MHPHTALLLLALLLVPCLAQDRYQLREVPRRRKQVARHPTDGRSPKVQHGYTSSSSRYTRAEQDAHHHSVIFGQGFPSPAELLPHRIAPGSTVPVPDLSNAGRIPPIVSSNNNLNNNNNGRKRSATTVNTNVKTVNTNVNTNVNTGNTNVNTAINFNTNENKANVTQGNGNGNSGNTEHRISNGDGNGISNGNNGNSLAPRAPQNRKSFRTTLPPRCSSDSNALPCENDDEYSDEIARRIRYILAATHMNSVLEHRSVSQLLNDSAIVRDKTLVTGEGFTTRAGFVSETPACPAQESIIYPQRAKTTQDDWVFVLNQDNIKQGVRVEKCLREGQSCDLGTGMPPTIHTTCRQKFIYRKLLVLSDTGADIQPESVLIPSCCVCYIRKSDNLVTGRIGVEARQDPEADVSTAPTAASSDVSAAAVTDAPSSTSPDVPEVPAADAPLVPVTFEVLDDTKK